MNIKDIFKPSSAGTFRSGQSNKAAEEQAQLLRNQQSAGGEDTVQISSAARQFAQIGKIVTEDESASADRVAKIKEQIDSGEYNVSSKDVARAFIRFSEEA